MNGGGQPMLSPPAGSPWLRFHLRHSNTGHVSTGRVSLMPRAQGGHPVNTVRMTNMGDTGGGSLQKSIEGSGAGEHGAIPAGASWSPPGACPSPHPQEGFPSSSVSHELGRPFRCPTGERSRLVSEFQFQAGLPAGSRGLGSLRSSVFVPCICSASRSVLHGCSQQAKSLRPPKQPQARPLAGQAPEWWPR